MSYSPKHTFNTISTIFHVKGIAVKPLDPEKVIKTYQDKVEKIDDRELKGKVPINILKML